LLGYERVRDRDQVQHLRSRLAAAPPGSLSAAYWRRRLDAAQERVATLTERAVEEASPRRDQQRSAAC